LVGTNRCALHRQFKELTVGNCLKVRVLLLPYQRLTPSQNNIFVENLPAQQDFSESCENLRILADTAMQADMNPNAMTERIVHSDLSD
jgi:hypothetical protein